LASRTRVLVLGTGERARRLARQLEDGPGRARVHGFLDDAPQVVDREALGARYLGKLSALVDVAAGQAIERVLFALPRRFLAEDRVANLIGTCEMLGLEVVFPLDLFEMRSARPVLVRIGDQPGYMLVRRGRDLRAQLAVKRAVDVIGALLGLILTLPLWLVVIAAIKFDSPGPVFFVQRRCGRFGRAFPCYKFRTMVHGAEAARRDLAAENEQSGPAFKMRHDPRITRVGRFLRRYSIDELPQLVNVLLGRMSLVGPRPPLPEEVVQYEIDHRGRLSMRPGITCLWQVAGRAELGFADWVRLDMEYIERWSLWLDLGILLLTVPAVISGRGAS
jgi:exopolysaccharide biosynthesis polyprenyl glycosylphosphotransferase